MTVTRYGQITTHAADGSTHYSYLHRGANGLTLWAAGHHVPGAVDVAPTSATRLAAQIRTVRALGIGSIFVKATRNEAWRLALMGYDSPIHAIMPHETSGQTLPPSLSRYPTVQALMRTPTGRAWVERYLATPGLSFDPRTGSSSVQAFSLYLRTHPSS